MKERLLKFLEEESLTAAKFADEIGVQRSSISHILSGRNNPGYDFFQKILKRYPHLNAEWLIMGTGKMTKAPQQASLFTIDSALEPVKEVTQKTSEKSILDSVNSEPGQKNQKEPTVSLNPDNSGQIPFKSIEKLVILYTDSSFKEYIPSK